MKIYFYIDMNGNQGSFTSKASLPINRWIQIGMSMVKILECQMA